MVQFTTPPMNHPRDVEFDLLVTADSFPTGLSGFRIGYGLTPHLQLVDVDFPASFTLTDHTPPTVIGVDMLNSVFPGAVDVPIVTFRLKITGLGPTELSLNVIQLDDDVGDPLPSTVDVGTITVSGVELLVHAFTHAKAEKGAIQTARSVKSFLGGQTWGSKERLPNYVRITLTDAIESDIRPFQKAWLNTIRANLVSQAPPLRVYMLDVSPAMLAAFGASKAMTPDIVDFLNVNHGATNSAVTPDRRVLTLRLPEVTADETLLALQDQFEKQVAARRFKLSESDVDAALAGGGSLTTTLAAIAPNIIDRDI